MPSLLIDIEAVKQSIQSVASPIKPLKEVLAELDNKLDKQFANQGNIIHIVQGRAQAIDEILKLIWEYYALDQYQIALIAVGGYGRGELHPKSDIDFLILHHHKLDLDAEQSICDALESFVTLLWDIGLDIGQSVRTVQQCIDEACNDITIISNLMESRFICGCSGLFEYLKESIEPEKIWPTKAFVQAKMQEQKQRHQKFNDTAYNLEPNIKEGPGGLRDIQIVGWIAKRHFKAETLKELVTFKFLTTQEYNQLEQGQSFLWTVRYALHRLSKRKEERLLFDYQRDLSVQLGYGQGDNQSVEAFMRDYYKNIMELERLSEILLQYFLEVIIQEKDNNVVKLNRRFVLYKQYISTVNDEVFHRYPFALLEIFLIMASNPEIKGVRASTIRQIRANRYLIDDTFRKDLRCRSLFMEILRQNQSITTQMRRMNRYGVLAEYIPAFKQIVGQMQHDLYHSYTVDEHTLRVLRNVRRSSLPEFIEELPLASEVYKEIQKPELLYLAALFHDIGKGRGGDHSKLGAIDAEAFCQLHDLSPHDVRLVTWLVRSHLEMSTVAQRNDLGDPQVIYEFALKVRDITHLNHLYLLTVSDIRATSPKVWNSWKDSLLRDLYHLTKQALSKGLEGPMEQGEKIKKTQTEVIQQLSELSIGFSSYQSIWDSLPKDYFLQHNAQEIVWHTENIFKAQQNQVLNLVSLRNLDTKGSTEVFIYMPDKPHVFALVTSQLSQLMLDVNEANTYRTDKQYILHTYHLLDEHGKIIDEEHLAKITRKIENRLTQDYQDIQLHRSTVSRTLKQFSIPTEISFSEDLENNCTIMSLSANNRPSVLSKIGYTLIKNNVHLVNTRISTFGEKIEDVFYITDLNNQIITNFQTLKNLQQDLIKTLDEE